MKTNNKLPLMESLFEDLHNIGSGSFATVFRGKAKENIAQNEGMQKLTAHKVYAIKNIQMEKLANAKLEWSVKAEINVLQRLSHPNIVQLFAVQQAAKENNEGNRMLIVMEYCDLGDLAGLLNVRGGFVDETLCQNLIGQLANGLKYMRRYGLVHRDLKPQNLLLKNPPYTLKIADFGFVKCLDFGNMTDTLCGSPYYMAPEILRYEPYDEKVDLWSIGVITFEMLFGKVPFRAANHIQLLGRIESTPLTIPSHPQISNNCRDFLISLLKKNPSDRISFESFFRHPFICHGSLSSKMTLSISCPALVKYQTLIERPAAGNSSSPKLLQSAMQRIICEKDYIIVDKNHTELNSFADAVEKGSFPSSSNQQKLVKSRSVPNVSLNSEASHAKIRTLANQGELTCLLAENLSIGLEYLKLHEALLLYLLSLKCYQRCMVICKQLWAQGNSFSTLANLVQKCRNSYNAILKKAERLCVNLLAVDNHLFDGNVADIRKILFEHAIAFAKDGVNSEMKGITAEKEANYQKSIALLELLLDFDASDLPQKDRIVIKQYINKIRKRQTMAINVKTIC